MNELKSYIIDLIKERLAENEDRYIFGCDVASEIFEGDRVNGTITMTTDEAQDWIKDYFDDIGEIYEEIEFQFGGEFPVNPFKDPDMFMVVICTEGASYILSQCELIDKSWNDELLLDEKNIEIINKYLDKCNNTYEFYSRG